MPEPWFCAWEKKKHGPFQFADLVRYWAESRLTPEDYVLQNGAQKWIQACEVPRLPELGNFYRDLRLTTAPINEADPIELTRRFDSWSKSSWVT
jgi:GYF domain 2